MKIKRWWLVGAVVGALFITLMLMPEWIGKPPNDLPIVLIFSTPFLVIGIIFGAMIGYLIGRIDKKRSLLIGGIVGMFLIPFITLEILGFVRGETLTLDDHINLFCMSFSLFYSIFFPLPIVGFLSGALIGYIVDNGFSAVLKIRKWILGAIIGFMCGLLLPLVLFFLISYQPTTTGAGFTFAMIFFFIWIISPITGAILGAILGWLFDRIIKTCR